MNAFLFLITLIVIGFISSFGITYLLFNKTQVKRFLFEGSLLFYPVWVVLFYTFFGYFSPEFLPRWNSIIFSVVGVLISGTVFLKAHERIAEVARINLRTFSLNLTLGISSATFLLIYFHKDVTEYFPFLSNGEYLNYSLLASALMGKYPFADAQPWISFHRELRIVRDIFIAHASHLLRVGPWLLSIIASGFFRFLSDFAKIHILSSQKFVPRRIDPSSLDRRELSFILQEVHSF